MTARKMKDVFHVAHRGNANSKVVMQSEVEKQRMLAPMYDEVLPHERLLLQRRKPSELAAKYS